jgi:homogentisate phytyltransferase/homogentisate geranylgeranyltransferase
MSPLSPHQSSVSANAAVKPNQIQQRFPWLYAFWKFSRPHTIIGTSLSAIGVCLLAWAQQPEMELGNREVWLRIISTFLPPLFTCLCGNVYIVGLNQIEDVAIDRVNKPHLPLASGEFSRQQAWAIVITTGCLALVLSLLQGWFLVATVWGSLLIGTAYSLNPIRLKRFPFWAALCIFSVRGAIVNLGLFLHFNQQLGGIPQVPATVWALTLFILVFTFAIAILKDIPDLEGDKRYHITTFTIRLGATAVFKLARTVLSFCYLGMMVAGLKLPNVNPLFLISSHLLILILLWWRSLKVDLHSKAEIARFYQFVWKLFFLEYLMFPAACLLS